MISDLFANSCTASSSKTLLLSCLVLFFLMASISLAINLSFSSLFFMIVHHLLETNTLIIKMSTVNRALLDK